MLGVWILALFLLSTAEGKLGLVFVLPFYAAVFPTYFLGIILHPGALKLTDWGYCC